MSAPIEEGALYERVQAAAQAIRERSDVAPQVGLILGSGLGAFADTFNTPVAIDYATSRTSRARTSSGTRPARPRTRGGASCVAMQGRVHMYEGHSAATAAFPARVLVALGARVIIVTNAAGGLNPTWMPGTLMLIRDHIDLLRDHALRGPNDERLGPRFRT